MKETAVLVTARPAVPSVKMSLVFRMSHMFHVRVDGVHKVTGETLVKTLGMFKTSFCGACTVLEGPVRNAYMVEYDDQTGQVLDHYSREDCKEIYTKRLGQV